jgi:hypothetical protein
MQRVVEERLQAPMAKTWQREVTDGPRFAEGEVLQIQSA